MLNNGDKTTIVLLIKDVLKYIYYFILLKYQGSLPWSYFGSNACERGNKNTISHHQIINNFSFMNCLFLQTMCFTSIIIALLYIPWTSFPTDIYFSICTAVLTKLSVENASSSSKDLYKLLNMHYLMLNTTSCKHSLPFEQKHCALLAWQHLFVTDQMLLS